jgi:hypothetical protein
MTASALPALQLRDIHIPAAAPFWPPAPGWWLIGFAILLLLAWAGALAWRRRRLLLARRRIVDALAELEADFTRERSGERLGRISLLLRRLALSRYPRERVHDAAPRKKKATASPRQRTTPASAWRA